MIVSPRSKLSWLVLPIIGCGLAGCLSSGGGTPPPAPAAAQTGSGGATFTDRMTSTLFGAPARPGEGRTEQTQIDCPVLDVRQGASTITVYVPGDQVATNVRYQANVGQLARECALLGAAVTMKIGLQGRIIVGPQGGPGRLDVPVRFALVHEGPNPKTIWTKLYRVPVDIPAGQTHVTFTHVEDNVTFPNPKDDIVAYVAYVGFDKEGLKEQKPRGRRGSARR